MAALSLQPSRKSSRLLFGLLGAAAAVIAVEHVIGVRQAARRRASPQAGNLQQALPRIPVFDTLGFHLDLTVPTLAKSLILRRPWVMRIADWRDLDRRAIQRMAALRDRRAWPGAVAPAVAQRGPAAGARPGRTRAEVLAATVRGGQQREAGGLAAFPAEGRAGVQRGRAAASVGNR